MSDNVNTASGCTGPSSCYAVFVRKQGQWIQQSMPLATYKEAQDHAKLVRRCVLFIEKTRVRRLPHNSALPITPNEEDAK